MSRYAEELTQQIDNKRIIFNLGTDERLTDELLGRNQGTHITEKLQILILASSKIVQIKVTSLIRPRTGTRSHHQSGQAVDIGNTGVSGQLLPQLISGGWGISLYSIDEIIVDARVINKDYCPNRWNYDRGKPHCYGAQTLSNHNNHIHLAVKS